MHRPRMRQVYAQAISHACIFLCPCTWQACAGHWSPAAVLQEGLVREVRQPLELPLRVPNHKRYSLPSRQKHKSWRHAHRAHTRSGQVVCTIYDKYHRRKSKLGLSDLCGRTCSKFLRRDRSNSRNSEYRSDTCHRKPSACD